MGLTIDGTRSRSLPSSVRYLIGPEVRCVVPTALPPTLPGDFGSLYFRGDFMGRVEAVSFRPTRSGKEIRITLSSGWVFARAFKEEEWRYGE